MTAIDPKQPLAIRRVATHNLRENMEARTLATLIWRIVGAAFIIYGIATGIVQFVAVTGTFGQIMDDESLLTGTTLFAIFVWPVVLSIAGIIIIFLSRGLAGLVARGLDVNDR